jgi:hypothetical protein
MPFNDKIACRDNIARANRPNTKYTTQRQTGRKGIRTT